MIGTGSDVFGCMHERGRTTAKLDLYVGTEFHSCRFSVYDLVSSCGCPFHKYR